MAFNSEQIKILNRAQNDFTYFVEHIGSKSIQNFVMGEYVKTACRFQSQHKKTIRLAFRSGMKSKLTHLFLMWKIMFQGINNNIDIHYYSYKEDLAGLHIREVKKMIAENPYFDELIDLKTRADSIGEFTWDRKHIITIRPRGIVSASRGIKGDIIIADDILSDPAQPIVPTLIFKVNELFKSVILENIKPDGEIHVLGSPISVVDFYFDPDLREEFAFMGTPSIINKDTSRAKSAWPEFISLEELLAKEKSRGPRIFEREFQITPFYSTDSFFQKDYLMKNAVNLDLVNLDLNVGYVTDRKVVAGFDVGKKRHPSLLCCFLMNGSHAQMIHFKFMEGWPYFTGKDFFNRIKPSQLEYLKEAIKAFNIDELYYDATRGEFESAIDQGIMPPQMIPIVSTHRIKESTATAFDKAVLNKEIEIINDDRLLTSITQMTKELMVIEDRMGNHGEGFTSIALCFQGINKLIMSGSQTNEITVGQRSIFDDNSGKIPEGF